MKERIILQMNARELIDILHKCGELTKEQWIDVFNSYSDVDRKYAASLAREIADRQYDKYIYIRGLIEFTNYCKNDCFYCGIRASNKNASRYRLTDDEIMECCKVGYELGFRTFVLQGGEDGYYSDDWYEGIIRKIKEKYKDCAITLSVGERDKDTYLKWFKAGADRYLLRHETVTEQHYRRLHPQKMSLNNRLECLYNLKDIGYQVGCGIMVGSPYQTVEHLANDMIFIKEFQPHMVGIGPYIPHADTPFKNEKVGSYELTLFILSLVRIMLPNVLLPATTALGTIHPKGREEGILAGANVIMPNLSPTSVRSKYSLYDNKICTGEEAAECRHCIDRRISSIGYKIVEDRGDYRK